ncbi:NUDIX domain-containing protein [Marinospirillum alkaliphilum]|uniref:ADP-ribose pyrophosphatase n=1 Tax=Marinospirillum alkaliphilum DSM 21637 TaxID=1122209 RepID=A0A1K1YEG0_9GAMM|nr:NUDIX domain-containing protein [Marinospirillum alkaliphilum]SFX60394.1 ADP-ribose pyrophosphatase [Marinospirillum alkaliphilum DSM 21637]
MIPTPFTAVDYTLEAEQPVYQGFFAMHKLRLKHRRFAGGWTDTMSRELLLRGRAVGVLAYDPWQDQVVLVEQFRVGALQDQDSPWLLEMIAGMVEAGETPESVAHREAMEEAGLQLLDLQHLFTYYSSPGGTDEQILLYAAIVDARGAGGLHGLQHEHEDIRVLVLPRQQAWQQCQQGRARNAMSLIALQWLEMNHTQMQHQWQAQRPLPTTETGES